MQVTMTMEEYTKLITANAKQVEQLNKMMEKYENISKERCELLKSQNMYEDWDIEIKQDITKEDIKDIQVVLDRILSRSDNISYIEKEQVKIDMEGMI